MTRKETTKFLTDLLITDRLLDRQYYAKEVTVDANTSKAKRVDVMQFVPAGVFHVSDIEKGRFICYEIKSCIQDIYSGNGLNFIGDENYIVTTAETYKKLLDGGDIGSGKLHNYIKENYPDSSLYFDFMVAVPKSIDGRNISAVCGELDNPTTLDNINNFKLLKMHCGNPLAKRDKSLVELMFCMLRAKHNWSNRS